MLETSDSLELLLREFAHGALTVFDIAVIALLVNYLWGLRGNWRNRAGVPIAFAIIFFVASQMLRSGVFWIEYGLFVTRGIQFNPSLGSVALSVAPPLVLLGLAQIIWVISSPQNRWLILIVTTTLAITLPALVHFYVFAP